ncbi:MAG: UvrD-helicase domain-containing protein [Candidatus Humimicrobiaceae bacterium]
METVFNLTQEQQNIINSKNTIKKVIACAGSGKTSVLTSNIAKVINDGFCKPEEILALTFTNNAAENMHERIRKNLGKSINADSLDIFTFNSFGNLIIKENSLKLGLGKNFKLINDVQSWQIIYEIFKDYKFKKLKAGKDTGKFVNNLLNYVLNLKNNLINSQELADYLKNNEKYLSEYKSLGLRKEEEDKILYISEFYEIYENYERIKKKNNYIDYADQIFLPYFLFKDQTAIKEKYIQKYKYIFVDEFQDTNNAQAYLLSMLFQKEKNKLIIVGDDDQGIYGFRGACIENIQDLNYFPKGINNLAETFLLTTNFRSGKNIINFTNSVIMKNKKREVKVVKPENENKKSSVVFFKKSSLSEEAEQISRLILGLESRNHKLKDIAVLCRKKRFNEIIKSFRNNNIRYEAIGSKSYFYEPEILFLISWMKIIYDLSDDESVVYLLKSSKYKISDRDICFLRNFNNKKFNIKNIENIENYKVPDDPNIKKENTETKSKCSSFYEDDNLLNAINNSQTSSYFEQETKKRLEQFLNELTYYIKNSELLSLDSLINTIFHYSGLYDELNSRFGMAVKKKIRNVENLIKLAWEFEENNFNSTFDSFVVYLKDIAKTDYEDPDFQSISKENSVKLMSIHAAKGLEFNTVFLPMLWESDYSPRKNQKNFYDLPSALRKDGKIWKEKSLYKSVKIFEEDIKLTMQEEERRIFYVAGSRAKETLFLSFPQFGHVSDVFKEEGKEKNILSFINDIFKENSNVIFFGDETGAYLKEAFNIKPQIYIKNEVKLFNDFLYSADENNLEKQAISKNIDKNKKTVSETDPGKYEKVLAENIFKLPDDLKNFDFSNRLKLKKSIKINEKEKINFFSLTEILTYIDCASLYKYKYIINIPEAQRSSAEYGIKIHKFIENVTLFYFKSYPADLLKENTGLLKEKYNPVPEYVNNKNQENSELKNYINNFYKSGLLNFDFVKNIFTEYLFYWKIHEYFLTCKIDRINILNNGQVELYDYKTSGYKENNQHLIYVNQIKAYICGLSDLLGVQPENIKGNIFYLKEGKKLNVEVSSDEKNKLSQKFLKTIKEIINKNYNSHDPQKCSRFCNYRIFCNKKNCEKINLSYI